MLKLIFSKDYKPTEYKYNQAKKLIKLIRKHKNPTGAMLAREMKMTSHEVRTLIKTIRENLTIFFKNEYLVAFNSGYKITSDKKEIKAYKKKLQALTHSKTKQLNEHIEMEEKYGIT